ncbi:hypothetical protein KEM55_003777 [Ascosphaera atra]|nr:hypothetical protein KEM55_003777 [Ascosphaera atra]
MACRRSIFSTIPSIRSSVFIPPVQQCQSLRLLHKNMPPLPVPKPTPFVPDMQTFLKLIGRNMSKYASKLESWNDFFTMTSDQLRNLGIEVARDRKYLLRWREKFRRGEYGVGGDLDYVVNGVAELRAIQVPRPPEPGKPKPTATASLTRSPGMKWAVVNLPPGETTVSDPAAVAQKKYAHIQLYNGNCVKGPYLNPVKGTNYTAAQIKVQEGMWEHKLGRKIDGGERKRAEVRAKKRAEQRKQEAA